MEENKTIIESTDRSRIKSITFKYPELMSADSENKIRLEYYAILGMKDALHEARDRVRVLEKELEDAENAFKDKSKLFTMEFETSQKEVVTYKSNMAFKGFGNDTLGRPPIM